MFKMKILIIFFVNQSTGYDKLLRFTALMEGNIFVATIIFITQSMPDSLVPILTTYGLETPGHLSHFSNHHLAHNETYLLHQSLLIQSFFLVEICQGNYYQNITLNVVFDDMLIQFLPIYSS